MGAAQIRNQSTNSDTCKKINNTAANKQFYLMKNSNISLTHDWGETWLKMNECLERKSSEDLNCNLGNTKNIELDTNLCLHKQLCQDRKET